MALKGLLKTPSLVALGFDPTSRALGESYWPARQSRINLLAGYEGLGDAWTVLGSRRCRGFPNSPIRCGDWNAGLRARARDRGGCRRSQRVRCDPRRTIRQA